MMKVNYITVLLAMCLSLMGCSQATNVEENSKTSDSATVINAIMTRTSVRQYTDEPVTDAQIETLLRAAMAAPTAADARPWQFVVVKERAMLDSIPMHIRQAAPVGRSQVAITICGDMQRAFEGEARNYWIEDTSAATENLLLAAHAMGLGAVWCGVYPQSEKVKYISELLQLPEYIVPMGIVAIGHPAESPDPKDKWDAERVHVNVW